MSLILRDLLQTKAFEKFEVISGKAGLNREVSSVTVMDAPDIADWLKGGEILITTGYIMKDDTSRFIDLVRSIHKAGASSLFIKIGRFIDKLPDEVYTLSETLEFPIVSMPMHCAFIDVINPVLQLLISEQAKRLEISENIHRSFTNLVLHGGNTKSIISTLSSTIGQDAAFIDTKNKQFYISAKNPEFETFIQEKSLVEIQTIYKSYPIELSHKIYGYIIYSDSQENILDHYSEIAVEHAGTVLKLEIMRILSNIEIEKRHRNEFVLDIISNSAKYSDEINNKAAIYGWDFSKGLIAVLVFVDQYHVFTEQTKDDKKASVKERLQKRILEKCKTPIEHSFKNVIYALLRDSIVFILTPSDFKREDFYQTVLKACEIMKQNVYQSLSLTLSIGIGNYAQNIQEVHSSYTQAKEALKIVKTIYNGNKILFFKDSGVYQLFQNIYNTPEAFQFCKVSIGRLIDFDKQNNTDLFQTLICIKSNDWNLKKASLQLYIHYNTIKYRYKKIEEILGMNLEDSEERFVISLSIKLLRMKESAEDDDFGDCLNGT